MHSGGHNKRWTDDELSLVRNIVKKYQPPDYRVTLYSVARVLQEILRGRTLEAVRSKVYLAKKELAG